MTEPKRLGKYEILGEIDRGGFAVVYKARDTGLDRIVALKVLHPYWTADPDFAARFRREARAAARLRHPNVVTVYEAEGQLYIAMEYLPGRSLQALLEAQGLKVVTGAKTEAILGDECADSVRLQDGRAIPGELVIFSTGIRS